MSCFYTTFMIFCIVRILLTYLNRPLALFICCSQVAVTLSTNTKNRKGLMRQLPPKMPGGGISPPAGGIPPRRQSLSAIPPRGPPPNTIANSSPKEPKGVGPNSPKPKGPPPRGPPPRGPPGYHLGRPSLTMGKRYNLVDTLHFLLLE